MKEASPKKSEGIYKCSETCEQFVEVCGGMGSGKCKIDNFIRMPNESPCVPANTKIVEINEYYTCPFTFNKVKR